MRKCKLAMVAVALLACVFVIELSTPARAEFVYSLRFDQAEYVVAPGSTFDVQLIFREQATGTDSNRLTDTSGMTVADVKVGWSGGGSKVATENDAQYGTGFIGIQKDLSSTDIGMLQVSLGAGVVGTDLGSGIREVGVGTLTFTAASTAADLTTVSFADYDVNLSNLIIGYDDLEGNDTTFDVDLFGVTYGSMTIRTIPEPSSMVLASLAAACLVSGYGVKRFRKRHRTSVSGCTESNSHT